jgi:hypothetical protein
MNYYNRHIGDYLRDAGHLTLLEHGIYGRLLDTYYVKEGPLPGDQVARLIGARSKEEKAAMEAVLAEFFQLQPDGSWRQKRCDAEILRYQEKAARNREVGKKGGRPRTQKEPTNNPDGFQNEPKRNPIQYPVANNQDKDSGANSASSTHTAPSLSGSAALSMRQSGATGVNPSHPDLLDLLAKGVTPTQLGDLVTEITAVHGPKPMAYHLAAMKRRLLNPLPTPTASPQRSNRHDQRAETIARLTGRYREAERTERDITPDTVAVD